MLDTEMDLHLGRRDILNADEAAVAGGSTPATGEQAGPARKNRRNGHSRKTVSGDLGELTLKTPRDRNGTFEPKLIGKHQRRLAGFDEKILARYAKGMTTRDIQEVVKVVFLAQNGPTSSAKAGPPRV
jgi:transposase-like protein